MAVATGRDGQHGSWAVFNFWMLQCLTFSSSCHIPSLWLWCYCSFWVAKFPSGRRKQARRWNEKDVTRLPLNSLAYLASCCSGAVGYPGSHVVHCVWSFCTPQLSVFCAFWFIRAYRLVSFLVNSSLQIKLKIIFAQYWQYCEAIQVRVVQVLSLYRQ